MHGIRRIHQAYLKMQAIPTETHAEPKYNQVLSPCLQENLFSNNLHVQGFYCIVNDRLASTLLTLIRKEHSQGIGILVCRKMI